MRLVWLYLYLSAILVVLGAYVISWRTSKVGNDQTAIEARSVYLLFFVFYIAGALLALVMAVRQHFGRIQPTKETRFWVYFISAVLTFHFVEMTVITLQN